MRAILFIVVLLNLFSIGYSQNLLSILDSLDVENTEPGIITNSFKSVRLINGYTSDIAGKNDLVLSVSHRFEDVNQGIYDLFGLDRSVIRFGFEYGVGDRISIGFGRSNFEKLYDGFIKLKIANQSSSSGFPLSITLLEGVVIKSLKWTDETRDYPFSARMYYVHELLVSRKFSNKFSAQLSPTLVHRNMVETKEQPNLVPAIGMGANLTINSWLSVSAEYYHVLSSDVLDRYNNSLAVGVEIESGGGHIFQIHLSNSDGMTEKAFIAETIGQWDKGDIGIGFNIIRVFSLKRR